MLRIKPGQNSITLPKINRCFTDPCNLYQLILQKRSTNKIYVWKLRDLSQEHPLRYYFPFFIPDCLPFGEYNLFLVQSSEWRDDEIDDLYPALTYRQTDKGAILSCGEYIFDGDRLLVSSAKNVMLTDSAGLVDVEHPGQSFFMTDYSEDNRLEGELYEDLNILYCGLCRYEANEFSPIEGFSVMPKENVNTFKEYTYYNG